MLDNLGNMGGKIVKIYKVGDVEDKTRNLG